MTDHSHEFEQPYIYCCGGCNEPAGCLECEEEWHDCFDCIHRNGYSIPSNWSDRDGNGGGTIPKDDSGVARKLQEVRRAYLNEADMRNIGLDPEQFTPAMVMKSGKWYARADLLKG